MRISSSPSKNRSDRGRIDVFFRGLNWILKASLLILALASFSVASAANVPPESCRNNPDTCFAKTSNELKDGWGDYIRIDGDISWSASEKSPDESKIELYKDKVKDKECKKLSFIMDTPADKDCKFSMLYSECTMYIELKEDVFKFVGENGVKALVNRDSKMNVSLEGGNLKDARSGGLFPGFCDFKAQKDGGWCKFDFAFKKNDCDGTVRFDSEEYKLLATQAPTTVAPETSPTTDATTSVSIAGVSIASVPNNANTTPVAEAAGLSPWIIAGIVVAVLLLLGIGVGLLVYFLICRRKRRGSPQNMAEKGNAGSVCLTEMTCPTQTIATQGEASHMKSGSEMVGEPSANERKEDEERSKPASKVEVAKPVSQKKKKKDNTYQSLQKEEAKNVPAPSPSPAQENKPKRTLAPDELYEPLGDPDKAIPMHLSEKKISEKKKKKEDPYQRLDLLQKEGAKNAPATPSPSRSSKKKKSEKKKKDDHYHRLESLENEGKK